MQEHEHGLYHESLAWSIMGAKPDSIQEAIGTALSIADVTTPNADLVHSSHKDSREPVKLSASCTTLGVSNSVLFVCV